MKQPYFRIGKSKSSLIFIIIFFFNFIVTEANAQINESTQKTEKKAKPRSKEIVNAPNDLTLDQLVGRIVQLQTNLNAKGMEYPNDKLQEAIPRLCPDIPYLNNTWPVAEQLKKSIAQHFDQGVIYYDMLKNLLEDNQSQN